MKARKYITIDSDGKNAKITTKAARVEPWEICFPIEIKIPDSYFQRPMLSASVDFPDVDKIISSADVTAMREAVLEATGISLTIEPIHQGEDN